MDATSTMGKLTERRERAEARVSEVEAQARAAGQGRAAAQEALTEYERRGDGAPAERKRLETALTTARAEAEAPWAERVEGARRAVRDADQAVRVFMGAHLPELAAALEMDGAAAASRLNAACEELLSSYSDWQAIATRISALIGSGVRPGDVSYSRADAVARAAQELIQKGGEIGPQLRRDRYLRAEQPVGDTERKHAVPA